MPGGWAGLLNVCLEMAVACSMGLSPVYLEIEVMWSKVQMVACLKMVVGQWVGQLTVNSKSNVGHLDAHLNITVTILKSWYTAW